MSVYRIHFKTGSTMDVKAVSETNARDIASYFILNRGKVAKVEKA